MPNNLTHLRAAVKFIAFITGTLVLVPFQLVWMLIFWYPRHQSPIVRLWFRYVRHLLNIQVTLVNKKMLSKKQKIFLGNHISYIDIIILGAAFDCFFVAKSDVASWPVFGFLSKIGGTIFISRQRAHIKNQLPLLKKHLDRGQSLYLFPEGTTSNGRSVLPFKSSLLNVLPLVRKKPVIQPVSLTYTHVNGNKMETQNDFDLMAWYGDMTMPPHLWNVFRQKSFHATITVHHAVPFHENDDIKALSTTVHDTVSQGFGKSLPI